MEAVARLTLSTYGSTVDGCGPRIDSWDSGPILGSMKIKAASEYVLNPGFFRNWVQPASNSVRASSFRNSSAAGVCGSGGKLFRCSTTSAYATRGNNERTAKR